MIVTRNWSRRVDKKRSNGTKFQLDKKNSFSDLLYRRVIMATHFKIDRRVDVKCHRSCFLLRVFIYLLTFAQNWLFNSTLFQDLLFFIIPSEVSWVQLIARFKRQLLQHIYPSICYAYLTKQSALPSAFYPMSWERMRLSWLVLLCGAILWDYTVSVFKWNLETI